MLQSHQSGGPETFSFPEWNGWDSSVGIVIRYGLDSPGIEFRSGHNFPHQSRQALGPTQPPIQWVPGLSWGKVARAWH